MTAKGSQTGTVATVDRWLANGFGKCRQLLVSELRDPCSEVTARIALSTRVVRTPKCHVEMQMRHFDCTQHPAQPTLESSRFPAQNVHYGVILDLRQ
jgi:hypothetical protein